MLQLFVLYIEETPERKQEYFYQLSGYSAECSHFQEYYILQQNQKSIYRKTKHLFVFYTDVFTLHLCIDITMERLEPFAICSGQMESILCRLQITCK